MKNRQTSPEFFKSIHAICAGGTAVFYCAWAFCGSAYPCILRSQNSVFAQGIFLFLRPWLPLLIASIFGIYSARLFKISALNQYLKNQTNALLLPAVLGLAVFMPVQSYFAVKHNFAFGILDTLPQDFSFFSNYKNFFTHISDFTGADGCFASGVYGVLFNFFVFSLLVLVPAMILKSRSYRAISPLWLAVIFVIAAALLWLLPQGLFAVFNFSKILTGWLLGFFVLNRSEVSSTLKNIRHWLAALGGALGVCYVYIEMNGILSAAGTKALEAVYCMTAFCGVFALAKRYFDKPSAFSSTFNPLFFISFYFCQMLSVIFACIFLNFIANSVFAFCLTLAATLCGIICLHLIFKNFGALRIFLGIKLFGETNEN